MSCIDRKPHTMKGEKTVTMPRHLLFFDTETYEVKLSDNTVQQCLKLGWVCYYRRAYGRHLDTVTWLYFENPDDFWTFVFQCSLPKEKLWCIARNVVFDFTVVKGWSYLKAEGYKLKFFHNQQTTTLISVHKKGSSIVFLDSMNWFVESIAKTGERIGLPKLSIDFEKCSKVELSAYCRRDVEIELENFKLFIRFLESNNISRLCYTRGSTAMAAYLLRHYNTKIYIHNNREAIDLEREAYKGGRVECFFIGKLTGEKFCFVDVNSLYPFVMLKQSYPVKYVKILGNISLQVLWQYLKSYAVVARVFINTSEAVYPVRHYRTLFPVGSFWATLSTPELKYAFEHDHIKACQSAVIYQHEKIFSSYVDTFYKLRQRFKKAGESEYEELCKKMLNSLYGKFGQKGEEWLKIGAAPDETDREELTFSYQGNPCSKIRYLLGEVYILTGYSESFDSFPAIAAHVTAYARMYLWKIMQIVGAENYFYCDTDSLIVNEEGLKRLSKKLSATRLGGLKIQQECQTVSIYGCKDYSTETKQVIKGIRKNAVKITETKYQQELWPSFVGLLRKARTDRYTVQTVTKQLYRDYTKGLVNEDGSVVPFVLDEQPLFL